MTYDPKRHHRRSVRLVDHDYGSPSTYFVTIVTDGRLCILGDIKDGVLALTAPGAAVSDEWLRTSELRRHVAVDEFIVMPNHIHGLLTFDGQPGLAEPPRRFRSTKGDLGAIIRGFKGASTRRVNDILGTTGFQLWQRGYHEHVVRNEREYERIRQYIADNPAKWSKDIENPRMDRV